MDKKYILALDQGTTSSRAILFDRDQNMISVCQKEFTQIYPQEGWVEHDPMEIWSSQYGVMMEAVAQSGVSAEEIAGIGITNQRETTVLWDRNTGKPIYNAIVWQCRRTADIVDGLLKEGLGAHIKNVTGLVPDAYFSGSKIKWIRTGWRAPGSGQDGARYSSAPLTHGFSGSSRAAGCTSRITPTLPALCCSIYTGWTGTIRCSRRWIFHGPCCLRCAIAARYTAIRIFRAVKCL